MNTVKPAWNKIDGHRKSLRYREYSRDVERENGTSVIIRAAAAQAISDLAVGAVYHVFRLLWLFISRYRHAHAATIIRIKDYVHMQNDLKSLKNPITLIK